MIIGTIKLRLTIALMPNWPSSSRSEVQRPYSLHQEELNDKKYCNCQGQKNSALKITIFILKQSRENSIKV